MSMMDNGRAVGRVGWSGPEAQYGWGLLLYYCIAFRGPFSDIVLDFTWNGRMVTLEILSLVEPLYCGHFEAGMVSSLVSASKNRRP